MRSEARALKFPRELSLAHLLSYIQTVSAMAKRKTNSAATAVPANTAAVKPGKRARFEGPAPPAVPAATTVARSSRKGKSVASVTKQAPSVAAPTTFVVSAGSYERLLYGLTCTLDNSTPSEATGLPYTVTVTPYFAFPAHLSSLKAVAASMNPSPTTGSERKVGGKYLVSGGTDEVVKVWDLRRRREVGVLEGESTGAFLTGKPGDQSSLFGTFHKQAH